LGAYEILHGGDVPPKVAINEALELAKRYSTAQSSRFVNGVLDRLQMVAAAEAEAESPGEIATRDNESSSDKVSDSVS
jgi:N utilization substance protein B